MSPDNKCRCEGSGYVPFVKPDGRIIPHAKMVCPECDIYYRRQAFKANHRPDAQPSDFDFACSDTWRGFFNGERNQQAFRLDVDKQGGLTTG